PEFDRVEGVNGGYVLLAPSMDIAASLISSRGFAPAAFVLPKPRAELTPGRAAATPSAGGVRERRAELQSHCGGRHPDRLAHCREHHPAGRRGPTSCDGDHRRDRREARW